MLVFLRCSLSRDFISTRLKSSKVGLAHRIKSFSHNGWFHVAILGAGGGLGHLGVQFAAHLGLYVLAVDTNDKSLAFLHKVKQGLGSAGDKVQVADVRKDDVASMRAIMEETGDKLMNELGLDAAIILPESQAAFDTGMKLLKNHNTMVIVSFPENGFHFSAHDLVFRDITLVGSLVGRNYQLSEMLSFCWEI